MVVRQLAVAAFAGALLLLSTGCEEDLGAPPGGTSEAQDVNEAGTIVGNMLEPGLKIAPFILPKDGTMQKLPGSGDNATASAVNEANVVVGRRDGQAYRWSEGTGFRSLGSLAGPTGASAAADINDGGVIVGSTTFTSGTVAFAWHPNFGVMVPLTGLVPGGSSDASAINVHGDVAGTAVAADGKPHAVLWPAWGGIVDLGVVGEHSNATDVSDTGVVVGSKVVGNDRFAMVWWPGTTYLPVPLQPGGLPSQALAVDNSGRIVGQTASTDPARPGRVAVVWQSFLGPPTTIGVGQDEHRSEASAFGMNETGTAVGIVLGEGGHHAARFTW